MVGDSLVAKIPAQLSLHEGKRRVNGDSQGDPVDVGPRPGIETGVEIIRHTIGTVDPGSIKAVQLDRWWGLELCDIMNMQWDQSGEPEGLKEQSSGEHKYLHIILCQSIQ